jgi:hypothetical protein
MSNWESLQPKKNEKKLGFDLGMQLGEVADFEVLTFNLELNFF